MGPEIVLVAWILAVIVVGLAALRYGSDSRLERDWSSPPAGSNSEPRLAWHVARPTISGDARSIVRRLGPALGFDPEPKARSRRGIGGASE
ncbi:MAG: hypothetical protein ACRDKZ_02570 [Actinomycetota bacterium]